MYALKRHVRQHQLEVKPVGPAMVLTLRGISPTDSLLTCVSQTVSCRWKQCRMVCSQSNLVLHLNRHIDKGVPCIYDGIFTVEGIPTI